LPLGENPAGHVVQSAFAGEFSKSSITNAETNMPSAMPNCRHPELLLLLSFLMEKRPSVTARQAADCKQSAA
jgi:hypothetical protein